MCNKSHSKFFLASTLNVCMMCGTGLVTSDGKIVTVLTNNMIQVHDVNGYQLGAWYHLGPIQSISVTSEDKIVTTSTNNMNQVHDVNGYRLSAWYHLGPIQSVSIASTDNVVIG